MSSQVPLTEGNLNSLNRSQQYSNPASGVHTGVINSDLMNSGLHALMDGPAAENNGPAYLSPEAADSIVTELLQQYFHVQEWTVPWPRPTVTPLLFVPDTITNAFKAPTAPTLADLDAMSLGLVESIPLAHDLLYPEHERLRTQLSKNLDQAETQLTQQGLHAPYQTAKERNPDLPDEDFALIDVDFCSSGHGQRHLPSITFLMRPSYTEIGLAPAERREEERRQAVAQSMAPVTQGATQDSLASQSGLSQWNVAASSTFKHAKQLDVCYDKWVADAATLKFGLLPVAGAKSTLAPPVIAALTTKILNLVSYITANGVVLGARRNDTNQTFYNTQQGKLVGAILWKYLCSLAAEAWSQWGEAAKTAHGATPRLLNLPASTITARILDDACFDELALGTEETKQILASALEEVIASYTTAVKQSVAGNKDKQCPLEHTAEDYVDPAGLKSEVLPEAVELVPADASALAQRRQTEFESEVEAPLFLGTNVPLHPTLVKIADDGEASRRMTAAGKKLPADEELLATFKTMPMKKANGAVPLTIMPVFPDGYQRIAKDHTAPAYTYDFGNSHRALHHVVLNGERNAYIPGAYVPTDARTPNVLFNDRLHFRPINELGEKRNRRGDSLTSSSSAAAAPEATTAYTTGTTQSKFEKYLADQSSTISYVLKVSQPAPVEGDDDTAGSNLTGPVVTYARIPTLTRYKRAQARITADDVMKTVTISWNADETEAKNEQLDLVGADEDNANAE